MKSIRMSLQMTYIYLFILDILLTSYTFQTYDKTRKHSSRMRSDHAVTRPSSEPVSMRQIVDIQTPVKTLPFLAVGNKLVLMDSSYL